MKRFSVSSLRVRLLLLVLLAVVPLLGLIFYSAAEQRRMASVQVQENALRLARLAAGDQKQLVEGARQLLIFMSQLPAVRQHDSKTCNAMLAELLKQYPQYSVFGAVDAKGDPFCSAIPIKKPFNVSDRAWFQRARLYRSFAIGDYVLGRATGKASLNLGYPVIDGKGEIHAVVLAALDLAWLNRLAAKAQLPEGSALTMTDQNGTILARHPDPEKWVGMSRGETPIFTAILTRREEGTTSALGVDGVQRFYAFTPLRSMAQAGELYVSVGIPHNVAFADADTILKRNLVGLGIVGVLALVAAWIAADMFIVRPVNVLCDATRRLIAGDLSARTGLPYETGELGQLARVFDQMAEALHNRQTESNQTQQELQRHLQLNTALREINLAVTSTLDLHAVLRFLMEKIDILLPYTAVQVWLMNQQSRQLERTACWNLDENEWKSGKLKGTPPLVEAAVASRAPVVTQNLQTDPRALNPEFYRRQGLVSYLGVPLLIKGQVLGVLGFLTREEHRFISEEIAFLSTLAGQAAMAIHNSQLHEQTKDQAVELEKANQVKDEFLGFVSHELKTPVNVVMGYASLLQSNTFGEINSDQEKALEKVIANSRDLLNMINSLLEATKIKAGATQMEIGEVNLGDLFEELRSAYDVPLNKELSLVWDSPCDLPVVKTDGDKLRHILQNLMNNAIKYTDHGSVTVSARHLPNSSSVEFRITDTGLGIPDEALPFIFEMFRQVNGSETRSGGGVGLGLHIVKKFTELLGGEVKVESDLGKGSTFIVTLPTGTENSDFTTEAHTAKRILVVEDSEDSRLILVATLRCIGYETIEAETGTQGVEKALSEKPDLIVMDLGLPGMSGIDAARAVKENLITAHIPIIAHTAWSSSQWKEEALKVGMVDFLEKPVSRELMKATIEKFILPQESGKKDTGNFRQNKIEAGITHS